VTFWDQLEALWDQFLEFVTAVVIPNWSDLVFWIPIILIVLVIGPLLTILLLYHVGYQVSRPRTRARYAEYPLQIRTGPDGQPDRPTGRPFCERDLLVYQSNERRCEVCHEELTLLCPRCGVARNAALETCGNCGLAGRVSDRALALAPDAGPPAGGAAAA
jgi:hypothetical protein